MYSKNEFKKEVKEKFGLESRYSGKTRTLFIHTGVMNRRTKVYQSLKEKILAMFREQQSFANTIVFQ